MRLPEWQALVDQEVRDVRRIREILINRLTHTVSVDLHRGDHWRKQLKRTLHGLHSIEHAFLVFLHILVVGKRQRLQYR
ncbi:hypothetical protein D3C81_2113160 [compost metagenome]